MPAIICSTVLPWLVDVLPSPLFKRLLPSHWVLGRSWGEPSNARLSWTFDFVVVDPTRPWYWRNVGIFSQRDYWVRADGRILAQ
ncbi:hypothetical protein B0T26DRAFT_873795 [Lasiosphaeria miniovina]|uniref:Uncharacterized protein n=1 Tax=Lasiosphaeria miniovina TaxID=1954250 RepID=A0AA40AD60_9PEZI|nr:uncharacterized protein B0T26DRAFT_873795 [Lasiosphaeria miniovina]KAK0713729.1 hypothetical protein B0T26DRAFT_873795 [Lasiosphaeria miniovina]